MSLAALVVMVFTVGVSVWRYESALHHSDAALGSSREALEVERTSSAFARERATVTRLMLEPTGALLSQFEREQRTLETMSRQLAARDAATRKLLESAREGVRNFRRVVEANRTYAGTGSTAELAAIKRIDAAEAVVLLPLDTLHDLDLEYVSERRAARRASDSQALIAAVLSGLVAFLSISGLALYAARLLRTMLNGRALELDVDGAHREYTEMLQAAESEAEADELLKRQAERSIRSSSVVVMRRNNSADRFLPTTDADPELAGRLADAEPRSCLAVRFGRLHQQGPGATPLVGCAVCSHGDGYSTCHPLLVGGEVIGSALARHPEPLSDLERRSLITTVSQAGPVLANLRNLALARYRAATDSLTGLPNSRDVQDSLKRMAAHASRTVSPLAVLLLDVDHFKQVNDTYGHAAGDSVLAALASTVRASLRASDFVGRYGGEEFVILLPDTGLREAAGVAEKVREAIAAMTVAEVSRQVTASIGIAVLPEDAGEVVALLRKADHALYAAKSNGRNRVESASPATDAAASTPEASVLD